jgi:hypothetical protein
MQCFASEVGCHVDQIRVNGKVRQAATKLKQRLARIAVVPVLAYSFLDILPLEGILQLNGEDGQAIEEQAQVEGQFVIGLILELAHHTEDVGFIKLLQFRVQAAGWHKISQLEFCPPILHTIPKHIEHTAFLNLFGQPPEKAFAGLFPIPLLELIPLFRLGGLKKGDHHLRVKAQVTVVVVCFTCIITTLLREIVENEFLEIGFRSVNHIPASIYCMCSLISSVSAFLIDSPLGVNQVW